jgi:hypothetical protein
LVTIILEAFKLKRFILKLDEADGDIFCGRNFHKSCIQIFALNFWKNLCKLCDETWHFLNLQLLCFAADGSVFSP